MGHLFTSFWGRVLGFTFFEVIVPLGPIYAGFFKGNWYPALYFYSGSVLATGIFCVSFWLCSGDSHVDNHQIRTADGRVLSNKCFNQK